MFAALRQFSIFERLHDCHLDGLKEEKLSNEKLKKKRDFVKVFQVKKNFLMLVKIRLNTTQCKSFMCFISAQFLKKQSL